MDKAKDKPQASTERDPLKALTTEQLKVRVYDLSLRVSQLEQRLIASEVYRAIQQARQTIAEVNQEIAQRESQAEKGG